MEKLQGRKGYYSSDAQAIGRACTHVIGFFGGIFSQEFVLFNTDHTLQVRLYV